MSHDLFICHASEDKARLVRPLADELAGRGFSVWYDEFELFPGASLRQSIDKGLANCRYALVVLSRHFFAKNWPQWELNGLVQRHLTAERPFLIPIWHEVGSAEVAAHSPALADLLAIPSSMGVAKIADQIVAIVRPSEQRRAPAAQGVAAIFGGDHTQSLFQSLLLSLTEFACDSLKLEITKTGLRLSVYRAESGERGDELSLIARSSGPIEVSSRFPLGPGITGWAFRRAESVLVTDVRSGQEYRTPPEMSMVRSMLAVPIMKQRDGHQTVLGVLLIDARSPDVFTSRRGKEFFFRFGSLCGKILAAWLSDQGEGDV